MRIIAPMQPQKSKNPNICVCFKKIFHFFVKMVVVSVVFVDNCNNVVIVIFSLLTSLSLLIQKCEIQWFFSSLNLCRVKNIQNYRSSKQAQTVTNAAHLARTCLSYSSSIHGAWNKTKRVFHKTIEEDY